MGCSNVPTTMCVACVHIISYTYKDAPTQFRAVRAKASQTRTYIVFISQASEERWHVRLVWNIFLSMFVSEYNCLPGCGRSFSHIRRDRLNHLRPSSTDTSEVHTRYVYKVLSTYETRMFLYSQLSPRAKLIRILVD